MTLPYRESLNRSLKRYLVVCLSLAMLGGLALAQSGRKQKKSEQQPPVQGVNQPETRVNPEPEEEAPKPRDSRPGVLIASELGDLSMPMYLADIAREACIAELREARVPNVEGAKNQNRSDAIKAAKDGGLYVVHLELQPSSMSSSSQRVEFDLRYTLLEPKTAKVINSGAGYAAQSNRVPVPQGGGLGYEQRQIELQGRDAGRKVLKFLSDREGRVPLLSIKESLF